MTQRHLAYGRLQIGSNLVSARSDQSFAAVATYKLPADTDPNDWENFTTSLLQSFVSNTQGKIHSSSSSLIDGISGRYHIVEIGDQQAGIWISKFNGSVFVMLLRTKKPAYAKAEKQFFHSLQILD